MTDWECGISGCENQFKNASELLRHQMTDHDSIHCGICGEEMVDGIFSIKHVFEKHRRREYVNFYDATPRDIRYREYIKKIFESEINIEETYKKLLVEIEEE